MIYTIVMLPLTLVMRMINYQTPPPPPPPPPPLPPVTTITLLWGVASINTDVLTDCRRRGRCAVESGRSNRSEACGFLLHPGMLGPAATAGSREPLIYLTRELSNLISDSPVIPVTALTSTSAQRPKRCAAATCTPYPAFNLPTTNLLWHTNMAQKKYREKKQRKK